MNEPRDRPDRGAWRVRDRAGGDPGSGPEDGGRGDGDQGVGAAARREVVEDQPYRRIRISSSSISSAVVMTFVPAE